MVDLLLAFLAIGAAVLGWRRGMAVSLLAGLVFLLGGLPFAAIAAAVGWPAPALAYMVGGLLALVPLAFGLERVQSRVEQLVGEGSRQVVDRAGGALLNFGIAIAVAWFVAALMAIVPGSSPAIERMRSSVVLGSLVSAVPPEGDLGVLVLRSGLVPSVNGPLILAEPPEPVSATLPAVLAAEASVLQVRSTACDQIVTGTGWVAGPGIVVTNAHVVAGTRRSFLAGGPEFAGAPARVTAFDPVNDVAVLVLEAGSARLPEPLPIVPRVRHGERAAVIGFPEGGRRQVVAARIDRVATYEVDRIDGTEGGSAQVLALRAKVEPGNSGGPIVAEDGSVLGLVVSKALGQRTEGAYGVASADLLRVVAEGAARRSVETGPCLRDA